MSSAYDEVAVRFPGLDAAIIGYGKQHGSQRVIVYDERKIIKALRKQGMSRDDAWDWYTYNIECLYAGPGTPFIMVRK